MRVAGLFSGGRSRYVAPMSVRVANVRGRAAVVVDGGVVDVERRAGGPFGADRVAAVAQWAWFARWAAGLRAGDVDGPLDETTLGPPVPRPAKVFAIGVNY